MKTLLIVESPAKAKKFAKSLGSDYLVIGTAGHIRDLPHNEMGVEAPNYSPKYVTQQGKSKIIRALKDAAKVCDKVVIATDLDREGEAIAWHIQQVLKLKNYDRITFNSTNKQAILDALAKPRQIDMAMVRAQEARRVLDRRIGYCVSPLLRKMLGESYPGGRVQSPSVRLVKQRRDEIDNHVPVDYLSVELQLKKGEVFCKAKLDISSFASKATEFNDIAVANRAANVTCVNVSDIKINPVIVKAPKPFITTDLMQEATSKLMLGIKKVTSIAQELYQEGLITYIRTDAPALGPVALDMIRGYAVDNGFDVPAKPNVYAAAEDAQEAHEGIYPPDMNVKDILGLNSRFTADHQKLYSLIWNRTLACQMVAGKDEKTVITFAAANEEFKYVASGTVVKSAGWRKVYKPADDGADKSGSKAQLPDFSEELNGCVAITPVGGEIGKKKTKPPSLYNQATFLKKMASLGIGRPATIASIIETISIRHNYISVSKKLALDITPRGETLVASLSGKFSFFEFEYTRDVEQRLDNILSGDDTYLKVVSEIDAELGSEMAVLSTLKLVNHAAKGRDKCEVEGCDGHYMPRIGGKFEGCSSFPECTSTRQPKGTKAKVKRAVYQGVKVDDDCPCCKKGVVGTKTFDKKGTNKGREFFHCSIYGCKLFQWVNQNQAA